MNNLQIIILAAGKGLRMRSKIPKVLNCIAGKSMLNRVIDTSLKLKPNNIHVIVGNQADEIKKSIDHKVNFIQQKKQLGTADAVKNVLPFINNIGNSLILYADVPLIDVNTLEYFIKNTKNSLGVLVDELSDPTGYGRVVKNCNFIQIIEEKDASLEQKLIKLVNTGIMLIPNEHIHKWINMIDNNNSQGEYYLTDILNLANKDNYPISITKVKNNNLIKGVNDKIQLSKLEREYQKHMANNFMSKGLTLLDPNRFDLRGELTFGYDCIIDINVILKGKCYLGNNVVIGSNCVLKDVIIDDNSIISDFSHIEGCKIGINSKIGPFARIRADSVLGDNVKIGNFVEIKKSSIKDSNKINHLSYIGDSKIGESSNIGAGVITCNYDGNKKNTTIIGNNCFIGSGSMIIAPVLIEDNATIGAGSVITKNCPANKLSLSRSEQITIDNWKHKNKK